MNCIKFIRQAFQCKFTFHIPINFIKNMQEHPQTLCDLPIHPFLHSFLSFSLLVLSCFIPFTLPCTNPFLLLILHTFLICTPLSFFVPFFVQAVELFTSRKNFTRSTRNCKEKGRDDLLDMFWRLIQIFIHSKRQFHGLIWHSLQSTEINCSNI